jgi:hypothetical protein
MIEALGANPMTMSYNASAVINSPQKFVLKTKIFYFTLKNALAYYSDGVVGSRKLTGRRVGSRL